MTKTRLNVYLERDHSQRVDELAAMKRLSRSSIVAAALAAFLSPEGGERREAGDRAAARQTRAPIRAARA